jgi:hypothetical protein
MHFGSSRTGLNWKSEPHLHPLREMNLSSATFARAFAGFAAAVVLVPVPAA